MKRRRNPLRTVSLIAFMLTVGFCDPGTRAEDWYAFVAKWPDVPEEWRFASPFDMEVDSAGQVYVADTGNHRIRKFDSQGSLLVEWGSYGEGEGQFASPHGVAVHSSGNVYVVDTENFRIQKFDSEGTFLTQWGSYGTGDGQFSGGGYGAGPGPKGIALDSSGNVYVADTESHRIQKFDSDGNFLGKWGSHGTADGKFSTPHDVSVDPSGYVLVTDTGNHRIQKFDSSGGYLRQWGLFGGGDGEFRYPRGIAVDSSGDFYVADSENERIQKFNSLGNFLLAWGETGGGNGEFGGLAGWTGSTPGPSGVAIHPSGNVFIADTYNDRIQTFDSSGTFLERWGYRGAGEGDFNKPASVAIGPAGNVFVLDAGNHRIQTFDSSGAFVTELGSKGSGNGEFSWPFEWPPEIAVDSSGNVYVADTGNGMIQKFDSDGIFLKRWTYYDPGGGAALQPYGLAVGPSGEVIVTDAERSWVVEFDSEGNFSRKWGSPGTGDGELNKPRGVAVDASGNVYVADTSNHRIQLFDADRNFVTQWGAEGSGDGQFRFPHGIAVESSGEVFVCDVGNHRIQLFNSDGSFLTTWGPEGFGDGEFEGPHGVAVDAAATVYVADTGNHRIQTFQRIQPLLALEPAELSSVCEEGQNAPPQSFEVWNSGRFILSYTISDNVAWLSCSPTEESSSGERDTITVSYNTAGLPTGDFSATITIESPEAGNSPQQVEVTLTVESTRPEIAYEPQSLVNVCKEGENAPAQSLEVWNSGQETLSYEITDDVSWLYCSPPSGTSTGEHNSISIRYNTAGLTPGTYRARITISAPGADNNPRHVEVTLSVQPKPAQIRCQPVSLSTSCEEGYKAPPQSFEVWNSGGGVLHYQISDDAEWLSCTPETGMSTGEHDTIGVTYDTASLDPGTYTATITARDTYNPATLGTVGVTLTVHPLSAEGTLRAGSATTIQSDLAPFPLPINLDLPYDLTYLTMTIHFRQDLFTALSYTQAGRVEAAPAADGINNVTGEVHLVWMSLSGETVIPTGSGPIATIEFEQKPGVSAGAYPVTLSDVEARYGPQGYHLESVSGEIQVVTGSLDVGANGVIEPSTDIVYIHRYLVAMPLTVPSVFRGLDPSIPPDDEVEGRIDELKPFLDVDSSGGDPDPGTDIVYIYRYLVGMPTTVPTAFREIDPSIPPDRQINDRIAAINVPQGAGSSAGERAIGESLPQNSTGDVLRIGQVWGRRGQSITVPVSLDTPEQDLSYLRFWISYDETKLAPRDLLRAGRSIVKPMPDWLDKENARIRAVVESLEGGVAIPEGTGPVLEIVFDVVEDTTTADSVYVSGEVEAGLGPKRLTVLTQGSVVIRMTNDQIVQLAWEPFGGGLYTVLYCHDIGTGDWLPLEGTVWPITKTSWQGDPAANVPQRFYSVQSQ